MSGSRPTIDERIALVCRHLALVAIDGDSDEVAATLADDFVLHLDGMHVDRSGYLTLIAANHAAHPYRPPLDVVGASVSGQIVTVLLDGFCVARVRAVTGLIGEMWMAWDRPLWDNLVKRTGSDRHS